MHNSQSSQSSSSLRRYCNRLLYYYFVCKHAMAFKLFEQIHHGIVPNDFTILVFCFIAACIHGTFWLQIWIIRFCTNRRVLFDSEAEGEWRFKKKLIFMIIMVVTTLSVLTPCIQWPPSSAIQKRKYSTPYQNASHKYKLIHAQNGIHVSHLIHMN